MPSSAHILVVDDSPTQLLRMASLLEQDGFKVVTAGGGDEAIAEVNRCQPMLVVTDLQMEGTSGLDLVEILRGTHPSVPVIITTIDGSEEIAADALLRGAASYVPKRNLSTTLAAVVRQVLSAGEASRAIQQTAKCMIEASLKLELDNNELMVPSVIARLENLMISMALFDEGVRMQIGMALDEALLNAIVHGNLEVSSHLRETGDGSAYQDLIDQRKQESPYQDRKVYVRVHATPDQIEFCISDEGPGFDFTKVGDPTDPENLEKCGGRGLFMIHAFMDEISYNEKGNEISMTKRRLESDDQDSSTGCSE